MTLAACRKKFPAIFKNLRFLFSTIALCFFFFGAVYAQEEVIWMQSYGSGSIADFGPSQKAGTTQYTTDEALADDFNLTGTITRVDVRGYTNGPSPPTASSTHYYGLLIKFYASGADNKPGALQAEYFVPKDSPNFLYQHIGLGDLRVRLEPSFQTTGRHFMSAQLVMDPIILTGSGGAAAKWYWRSDDATPVREQGFYYRENANAAWTRTTENHGNRNLSMRLWGTRVLNTPPVISQLSASTLPQAGRLKITGTNFGNIQGTGVVRINGAIAPVSNWTETSITVYVSDASTLGAGSVEITTDGGTSNQMPFNVTARPPANGRVRWRVQIDAGSIFGRPAVAPDGTIYAVDHKGRLYSVSPDGGVKWVYYADTFAVQSPSAGADGTVYYSAGNELYAINPNGTLKWKIGESGGSPIAAGPNVGTDGNIYAVFANATTGGLSAIIVSSEGTVLDNDPSYFEPIGQAYGVREIVFGAPGQYYFVLNNLTQARSGFNFFANGGNWLFSKPQFYGQPAVAPDGTIYAVDRSTNDSLSAIDPANGNVIRNFGRASHPSVDSDGNIYAIQIHSATAISFNPAGGERWRFPGFGIISNPVVSPDNTIVSLHAYDFAQAGIIHGINASNGQLAWRVNLPAENGGYVRALTGARFSADSRTAYYGMNVNDYSNDLYTYLYAINASPTEPCSFGITPSNASFPYNGGTGSIEIQATNENCAWTATSDASWITVLNPSGTGSGAGNYTVSANPDFTTRTGTITIAGQTFTVTQAPRTTTTNVAITYPSDGQIFNLPTNIFINANSNNANGTVARVDFYANGALIGTDNSAPYQIVWNDPAATNYSLIAKSIDGNGVVTESEAVRITVNTVPPPEPAPLPISPPTLTNPTANQEFIQGESITFSATPGMSRYPTARVEFYLNTTLIGSDHTEPYSFTLDNVPAGIYTVSARTIAATGARATSQPIDIRVMPERLSSRSKSFDFDGDGKSDIGIFRPSGGEWWINRSSTNSTFAAAFGSASDKIVPGDYTGDGKTDVAFFRPSTGQWFVLRSENYSFYGFPFGADGDIAVPADYDGDGKTDAAVFRPSNNGWYIQKSSGGISSQVFGQSGDRPAFADYDGDGKTDIAIYRPESGQWWIQRSSNGSVYALQFGTATDKIVPADYTGDGKADIALFRPSNGFWYILRSEDNSFYGFPFGVSGDIPVTGDYDGDGKADPAVFRNSNASWYLQRSTAGFIGIQFGISGDKPVPSAFVP